ncbi:hypothetical protein C5167_019767 [Papaver somniferum]|uniref:Uncharacterized protein n=1 Tax=Papaver somniferum TaxID=3469 RepID=A0A4Y7IR36_PAPSO|nr:hypothetical protein C5167_019767 [Papaver somniferum]
MERVDVQSNGAMTDGCPCFNLERRKESSSSIPVPTDEDSAKVIRAEIHSCFPANPRDHSPVGTGPLTFSLISEITSPVLVS